MIISGDANGRLYVNCFQPSMKLLSKQREWEKVRCFYDPAKTPLQRLLQSGVLPAQRATRTGPGGAGALDPIHLFHQLELLQQAVFRCAVNCSPCVPSIPPAPLLRLFCRSLYSRRRFLPRGVPLIRQQAPLPVPRAGAERMRVGLAAHPQNPFRGRVGADPVLVGYQS